MQVNSGAKAFFPILILLALVCPTSEAEDVAGGILSDDHKASLEQADASIESALSALGPDAHGRDEVPEIRALLGKERSNPAELDLVGNWKVRSIQVGRLGLFSYPYFKARVQKVGGMLLFEKTTGSQRRSGLLLPHTGGKVVLLGGKSVNDDPQVPYSRLGGNPESDTAGWVFKIGEGELLMLLDTSANGFEIYQLKR